MTNGLREITICQLGFQSTQSSQTVTTGSNYDEFLTIFQSTQSSQTVTGVNRFINGWLSNFNPHSPRRLWPVTLRGILCFKVFQSTQSSQTVTAMWGKMEWGDDISIHTVLADCDCNYAWYLLLNTTYPHTQCTNLFSYYTTSSLEIKYYVLYFDANLLDILCLLGIRTIILVFPFSDNI